MTTRHQKESSHWSNLRILQIETTSSKCTVSIRNIGSTVATRTHFAPTSAISAQLKAHMASELGTWPAQSDIPVLGYFPCFFVFNINYTSCWAMFPMLCLRWATLRAMLTPKGPKLLHLEHDLDFHDVHHITAICGPFGSSINLGSSWAQDSANWGALWGQPRPKLGPTRANLACLFTFISTAFFRLMRVHARPCSPHWACLGPNFARCPHTGPIRVC